MRGVGNNNISIRIVKAGIETEKKCKLQNYQSSMAKNSPSRSKWTKTEKSRKFDWTAS